MSFSDKSKFLALLLSMMFEKYEKMCIFAFTKLNI